MISSPSMSRLFIWRGVSKHNGPHVSHWPGSHLLKRRLIQRYSPPSHARPITDLKLVCTLILSAACAFTLLSISSTSLPLEISVIWLGLPRSFCHALLDSSPPSPPLLRSPEFFNDASEEKGEDNMERTLRSTVPKPWLFLSNGPSVGRQAAIIEKQGSM